MHAHRRAGPQLPQPPPRTPCRRAGLWTPVWRPWKTTKLCVCMLLLRFHAMCVRVASSEQSWGQEGGGCGCCGAVALCRMRRTRCTGDARSARRIVGIDDNVSEQANPRTIARGEYAYSPAVEISPLPENNRAEGR